VGPEDVLCDGRLVLLAWREFDVERPAPRVDEGVNGAINLRYIP
jgi:hypothetical protein